jgi:hypothetical protein
MKTAHIISQVRGRMANRMCIHLQLALPLLRDGSSIIQQQYRRGQRIPRRKRVQCEQSRSPLTRSIVRCRTRIAIHSGQFAQSGFDRYARLGSYARRCKTQMAAVVPLKHLGAPEEIANVVLFLASADPSFVTGIDLFVDGGSAQF